MSLQPWQQQFDEMVKPYEGVVPQMYLDTVGLVTVGRGCQVGQAEALTLPFYLPTGAPALQGDILRDYTRLQQAAKRYNFDQLQARKAAFWITPDSPRLRQDAIDALAQKRIVSATKACQALYPKFDTWPDAAKIATVEMVWGLGEYKYSTQYLKQRAFLGHKPPDFRSAASECAWSDPKGIYKARNANRFVLYIKAAQQVEGHTETA